MKLTLFLFWAFCKITGITGNDPGGQVPLNLQVQTEFRLVGGPCEGCEAIFEYGGQALNNVDTLEDFQTKGPGFLIKGTLYQHGSRKPAPGVILYIYHTNQEGAYPTRGNEKGWAKRHGYLRGWAKTDANGNYRFYTQIPGAYPSRSNPKHIHLTVLEPNGKYYYLESYLFKNDPLLTDDRINRMNPRGGGGFVVAPVLQNGLLVATRDIELGKNVPGYDH
ncbi:MAG: intradiol ring-cleavage dioxygenase [Cyclobacteriaceae bacterium]|nr:intradiol ring-cleavage dioxygenase [Cyclobacteriaceae bacterium]MCB0498996.1 intradiol ring-cleavage dioxygenase [Cyclobacteriaceae bacterium]MCB9238272.1 intradiol ring-cleavage dioxygenase [Flammeovirgaceae bacterium]MCO5272197.1 intradiol ring-cleavage dioxygenase [Cyclobacteriaceae bacterium]MCW5902688.1 intradiol ring-cleavage dioxygenase [Cyclobacteriaceae bacterium]